MHLADSLTLQTCVLGSVPMQDEISSDVSLTDEEGKDMEINDEQQMDMVEKMEVSSETKKVLKTIKKLLITLQDFYSKRMINILGKLALQSLHQ